MTDTPVAVPETAKKPTDRKPKAAEAKQLTVMAAGRDWVISPDALDDFELLDDLGRVDDGDPSRLPSLLRRLLGESFRDGMDAVRDAETGRVSIERGAEFVREILDGLNPN